MCCVVGWIDGTVRHRLLFAQAKLWDMVDGQSLDSGFKRFQAVSGSLSGGAQVVIFESGGQSKDLVAGFTAMIFFSKSYYALLFGQY